MGLPLFTAKWVLQLSTKIGALALVLLLAWRCWDYFGPHKPELGPVRQAFADRIIPTIVNEMRQSKGTIQSAALLHFENDSTDYVTNQFRTLIEHSGMVDLQEKTFSEKLTDLANLRQRSYGTPDSALSRGRDLGVQGVIFGKIYSFQSNGSTATVDVEVCLANVATGEIVFDKRYNKDSSPVASLMAGMDAKGWGFSWFQRFMAWLLVIVLLPVFTIGFIRAMMRKQSNRINAFVLGIYTVAGALLVYMAGLSDFSSGTHIAFFLIMSGCTFGYNVAFMTFALRLEGT